MQFQVQIGLRLPGQYCYCRIMIAAYASYNYVHIFIYFHVAFFRLSFPNLPVCSAMSQTAEGTEKEVVWRPYWVT